MLVTCDYGDQVFWDQISSPKCNHCPIATSSQCDRKQYVESLLTSKGKDVLSIAMKYNYVPLVRYLVVEKKFSLASMTSARVLHHVLETTLRIISIEDCNDTSTQQDPELSYSILDESNVSLFIVLHRVEILSFSNGL